MEENTKQKQQEEPAKKGGASNLKPFKKGDPRINRKGRPKKFTTQLKEYGYSLSEINDSIQNILAMDLDELQEVPNNPKATILEITVSKALLRGIKSGSLYSLETLLSRVYGQPKQEVKNEIQIQPPIFPDLNKGDQDLGTE
jgi:hypothetical protein